MFLAGLVAAVATVNTISAAPAVAAVSVFVITIVNRKVLIASIKEQNKLAEDMSRGQLRSSSADFKFGNDELSTSINDIASKVQLSAQNASEASKKSTQTAEKITFRNNEVRNMRNAMDEIKEKSA